VDPLPASKNSSCPSPSVATSYSSANPNGQKFATFGAAHSMMNQLAKPPTTQKPADEKRSLFQPLPRSPVAQYPFVIGEAIVALENESVAIERTLRLKKIHNQRQACRRINGTVLKSGEIFNFHRQLGPCWPAWSFFGGFFGGASLAGLLEMGSVLCAAAENAGLMIIDRAGGLRFAAPEVVSGAEAVLLETVMTPYELIVRVRSRRPQLKSFGSRPLQSTKRDTLGAQVSPDLHAKELSSHGFDPHIKTAALLDRFVPEFEAYLAGEVIDLLFVPSGGHRYRWNVPSISLRKTAKWQTLKRAFKRSWHAGENKVSAELWLNAAESIALKYAKSLTYDVEHLIVMQDFLPFLWRAGVLQGRSFDVLLTRPPLSFVHLKLDQAQKLLPNAKVLSEYRAPRELVRAESEALVFAERVITAHEEFARLYPNLRKLRWIESNIEPTAEVRRPRYLLLPSPLRTCDGAQAALAVAEKLGMKLLVVGDDPEDLAVGLSFVDFVERREIPWHEVAVVVHPTLFESWPRLHLHALALGIPVLASEACGLLEGAGVTYVPFSDPAVLLRSVARVLHRDIDLGAEGPRLEREQAYSHSHDK